MLYVYAFLLRSLSLLSYIVSVIALPASH